MSKTVRVNIIMIVATFIIAISYSLGVKAADFALLSKGAVVFDNETTETLDDVLYYADDFKTLYDRCK